MMIEKNIDASELREIRFYLNFHDYMQLIKSSKETKFRKIFNWLVAIILLSLFVFLLYDSTGKTIPDVLEKHSALPIYIGLFIIIGLFNWVLLPLIYWLHFKKSTMSKGLSTLKFHNNHLSCKIAGIQSDIPWGSFKNYELRNKHLLLWIDGVQAVIIPFRTFISESDKNNTISFISSKVYPR